MGKYENKIAIESCVKTVHEQQCTEHKVQSMIDELEMVYNKAKAFDEIVNEFHYQLQNLESWDTLDQKDCQTLKQILEENIEEGE